MKDKMLDSVLKVINDSYTEDKPYTGFTLIAVNDEGFRVSMLNIDIDILMKQCMVLMRETYNIVNDTENSEGVEKNELH